MTHNDAIESPVPEYVVEESKPFSQSLIWELQRRYYQRHGIKAWSEGRIPFSITTNPVMGYTYARLIYATLRDWLPVLDVTEPVYIIEIGAGSGRLGFNVLRQLSMFWEHTPLAHVRVCYVLTDLVEENVQFWQTHTGLQPFAEAGNLDFARFDAGSDDTLTLRRSGIQLTPGTLSNPLLIVANYIWDTLPQDLFFVENGEIYEVQTALLSEQPEPDKFDPELITRVEIMYDRLPTTINYYNDETMAQLLDFYRRTVPASILTFPYQAIRCLQSLARMANNRMVMLSADKGEHRLAELINPDDIPTIALHDTGFSTQFNYHAIGQFFDQQQGEVLVQTHRYVWLNVLACSLGAPATTELRQMYQQLVELGGPDDLFTALMNYDELTNINVQHLLAYLRMKRYDPHAFLLMYSAIQKSLQDAPLLQLSSIKLAIEEIWKNYYHMGEPSNTPFFLGTILHGIRDYANARYLYEQALALYGDHPRIRYNVALCRWELEEREQAKAMVAQILKELPDFPEAQGIYQKWLQQA